MSSLIPPSISLPSSSSSSTSTPSLIPSKRKFLDPDMLTPASNTSNTLLSQFHLPPLPDFGTCPQLPFVPDKDLERLAFIHSSYLKRGRNATSLEVEEKIEDHEKLEHVGDAILNSTVTLLLHHMYPQLQVGGATLIKGHLVSNTSLSQLSKHYNLPDRLIADSSQQWSLRNGEKLQADLFEAYVAALYLSYLQDFSTSSRTLPTPSASPTPSESAASHSLRTLSTGLTISTSSRLGTLDVPEEDDEAAGRAFAKVGTWLKPLFKPYAAWVLSELRAEQKRLEEASAGSHGDAELDAKAIGAMSRLNEYFTKYHKMLPDYLCNRDRTEAWTAMCVATDKNGKKYMAEATRSNQKAAKNIAAYKICIELGL